VVTYGKPCILPAFAPGSPFIGLIRFFMALQAITGNILQDGYAIPEETAPNGLDRGIACTSVVLPFAVLAGMVRT
jgi:hypothetical protein